MKRTIKATICIGLIVATMVTSAMFVGAFRTNNTPTNNNTSVTDIQKSAGEWNMNITPDVPSEALKAFNKAIKNYGGVKLEVIGYMGNQVVSGTNYKLLCKSTAVTPNASTKLSVVTVYENLQGNSEIAEVEDYNTGAESSNELSGGTIQAEDVTITKEVQKAFDKATKEYAGTKLEPIALVGTQVVSGTNYKLLCKSTAVTPNAKAQFVIATVYQSLDGSAEITDVANI